MTHNVLNAHAAAVARFRKVQIDGKISINLNSDWAEPFSDSQEDQVSFPLLAASSDIAQHQLIQHRKLYS